MCQGSRPWAYSPVVGLKVHLDKPVVSGQALPETSHWKRREDLRVGEAGEPALYTDCYSFTGLGVGNSFANLKILCFPEQKQAHSVIFIYNKWNGPV